MISSHYQKSDAYLDPKRAVLKSKDEQVGCDMTHSPVAQNKTKTVITLHRDHVDTIKRLMLRVQKESIGGQDEQGHLWKQLRDKWVIHSFWGFQSSH